MTLGKSLLVICAVVLVGIVNTTSVSGAPDTIVLEDGKPNTLRDALEEIADNGTIIMPAGIYYYRPGNMVVIDKSVTIQGSSTAETTLKVANGNGKADGASLYPLSGDPEDERFAFALDCDSADRITISNITFKGFNYQGDDENKRLSHGGVYVDSCTDFRIHDSIFKNFSAAGILVDGFSRGVIDNNEFIDNWMPTGNGRLGYGVQIRDLSETLPPIGTSSLPILGTKHAIFVEDNIFKAVVTGNKHSIAAGRDARYVFRHNVIEEGDLETYNQQLVDAHGRRNEGNRGTRSYEIYENTLSRSAARGSGITLRGGNGVIWGNEFDMPVSSNPKRSHIVLMDDGVTQEICDTYPCLDQIRDVHIWGNTNSYDTSPLEIEVPQYTTSQGEYRDYTPYIVEDRDYFLEPKSGYVPYTYPHPLRVAN